MHEWAWPVMRAVLVVFAIAITLGVAVVAGSIMSEGESDGD